MTERKINPFNGQHCETTATGTLLNQLGIELSEPMLFGLGEGLGFIFWNMKTMDFSFIGGRIKPDLLTENIVKNLGLILTKKETSSKEKAWQEAKKLLDNEKIIGLKLDCYHLDYFSNPIHFAAHYVAMYQYDAEFAYLVDTQQQGGKVKTSLKNLALARAEKGPMSSNNLYYTIEKKKRGFSVDLKKIIRNAIKNNANEYLNPPITNIGYKGILKTSSEIIKWFNRSKNIEHEFKLTARLMEKAGTGGALFRNLYRDFLKESYEIIKLEKIKNAYEEFMQIATDWNTVANLLDQAGTTQDIAYIYQASSLLKNISEKEKNAMKIVEKI